MNRRFVSSSPARYVPGYELQRFSVAGGPLLLFDWTQFPASTGLCFVVINEGAGQLTVTPESSFDGVHVQAGPGTPIPWTLEAGYCGGDEYGIDLGLKVYWRLWVSGTSSGQWGLREIPRW